MYYIYEHLDTNGIRFYIGKGTFAVNGNHNGYGTATFVYTLL